MPRKEDFNSTLVPGERDFQQNMIRLNARAHWLYRDYRSNNWTGVSNPNWVPKGSEVLYFEIGEAIDICSEGRYQLVHVHDENALLLCNGIPATLRIVENALTPPEDIC